MLPETIYANLPLEIRAELDDAEYGYDRALALVRGHVAAGQTTWDTEEEDARLLREMCSGGRRKELTARGAHIRALQIRIESATADLATLASCPPEAG